MKNQTVKFVVGMVGLLLASFAQAATDWSLQDYDLYAGDFNGDGKTDILYIAKDPAKSSGIAISDGAGPNISFQTWSSNYLGIQWYGGLYTAIVADFSGDGNADILLQRKTSGDSFLLIADPSGRFTSIAQTIGSCRGLSWSGDQHKVLAGNFSGRVNNTGSQPHQIFEFFLQATTSGGANAVVKTHTPTSASDPANGQVDNCIGGAPDQSWTDATWSAFKWSTANAVITVGDFDGDGRADLLVQSKPKIVMIDYDVAIPVPVYPPAGFGVALAQSTNGPFNQAGIRQWNRNYLGIDWSPNFTTAVVGNFTGQTYAGKPISDVLLQSKNSSKPSVLLQGHGSGTLFTSAPSVSANVSLTSDVARLIAGNFAGAGSAGLYIQSTVPGGTNYFASSVGTTITASTHDLGSVNGVLPATAVGATRGSFAVSNTGAANYSTSIVVPPGIQGMQPNLALTYSSQSGNGLVGVGWAISGLSRIEACSTHVDDGFARPELASAGYGRFCLDGNKLMIMTGSTYGADGSTYQTELQTFSRTTAHGAVAGWPAYFTVERKDGLTYEYGNTGYSRFGDAYATYAWLLDRVSDRAGNAMTFSYAGDGSHRVLQIDYTSNSVASVAGAYSVKFIYETRPAVDYVVSNHSNQFGAGPLMRETNRLSRIETYANSALVRTYRLGYQLGTTLRSQLIAIQECAGSSTCLSPTQFTWQVGGSGYGSEVAVSLDGLDATAAQYLQAVDYNGDGRTDLIYPRVSGSARVWAESNANGTNFDAPTNLLGDAITDLTHTLTVQRAPNVSQGGVIAQSPMFRCDADTGPWWCRPILSTYASSLFRVFNSTPPSVHEAYWSGDFNGDGTSDVLFGSQTPGNQFSMMRGDPTGAFYPPNSYGSKTYAGPLYNPFEIAQRGGLTKPVDFNGDGRADIIAEYITPLQYCTYEYPGGPAIECSNSTQYSWVAFTSNGSSLTQVATGDDGVCTPGDYCTRTPLYVGDFNGDGISDLIAMNGSQWVVYFGSASGLTTAFAISLPASISQGIAADFSGSSRASLLYQETYNGSWKIAQWSESAQDFTISSTDMLPNDAHELRIVDINGDGLNDIAYYSNGGYRIKIHNGPAPDLMNSATDGFGNQVAITYSSLNDGAVYSAGTSSAQPTVLTTVPAMSVVKQFTTTDGIGGSYTISEHYVGATQDTIRGFAGFQQRDETDLRVNGFKKHINYLVHDDIVGIDTMVFPFLGRPAHEWVTQADGTTISDITYTYTGSPNSTAPTTVSAHQTVSKKYEVGGSRNGAFIEQTTTTINHVDDYGNATDVTTVVQDQESLLPSAALTFTTNTVQSITNDTTYWCLGRPDKTTTTTTLGDGSSRTQVTSHTVDYQKCRVTDDLTNPDGSNAPTYLSVATHYAYDPAACGNPSAVTVTGYRNNAGALVALAPRTTQFGYASTTSACVAPTTIKDPYLVSNGINKNVTRNYDYRFGLITSEVDPTNRTSSIGYDGFGRLVSQTRVDGTSTTITFNACNASNSYCGAPNLRLRVDSTQRDTGGNAMSTSYGYFDGLGRIRIQDSPLPITGELSHVVSTYDSYGRLATKTVPYTSVYQGQTVYAYDLVGRQMSATLYDGGGVVVRQSSARYEGHRSVFIDPQGYESGNSSAHETVKVFDATGQLRTVKDPGSTPLTKYDYTFASNNLVSTVTDKAGNANSTTIDRAGNKISSQDLDMGTWAFEYTSLGELRKQTDAKNQVTTFDDYDPLGRPTTRHEVEGDTIFSYVLPTANGYGQLQSITAGGYTEALTYDSFGRVQNTHITIPNDASYDIDYAYVPATGLVDTVTYPISTSSTRVKVKYDYNSRGVQTAVRDYTNNTSGVTYWQLTATDAMGHATNEMLGNNVRVASGYHPTTGLMTSRQSGTDSTATNRQNLAYIWDASGNLQRRTDNNQAGLYERFYYDAINRLDHSALNGSSTNLQMAYDDIGNITQKTSSDTNSNVGTYNYATAQSGCTYYAYSQPHAVRNAGGSTYCYDANGNMTSRPGATVTWYSDNSVKKITQGSISSEFWYSPLGERFKQQAVYSGGNETTYYVGGMMDKVITTGGTAYRHYIAAGSSAVILTRWSTGTNQTYYVSADHIGSSSVITNDSGIQVVNESFDAFGKRRSSTWTGAPSTPDMQAIANATRNGYTGHEHLDNLGLIHMNGRVQDPSLGRFLSADPIVQAPDFSQSLNRYSYVWNNPLTMTDPSGFEGGCASTEHLHGKECWPDGSICEFATMCGMSFMEGELPTGWDRHPIVAEVLFQTTGPGQPSQPVGTAVVTGIRPYGVLSETDFRALLGWINRPSFAADGIHEPLYLPEGTVALGIDRSAFQLCMSLSCHGNNASPYELGAATPLSDERSRKLAISNLMTIAPGTIGVVRGVAVAALAARGRAFWIGVNDGYPAAQQSGRLVLRLTPSAQTAFDAGNPALMFQESAAWARDARGVAEVFVGTGRGYTFWNYEYPRLLNNLNSGQLDTLIFTH